MGELFNLDKNFINYNSESRNGVNYSEYEKQWIKNKIDEKRNRYE